MKRKYVITVCAIIVAAVLVVAGTVCKSAFSSDQAGFEIEDVSLIRNEMSVQICSSILDRFDNDKSFESAYAGAYIDKEGTLHLQFTEEGIEEYSGTIVKDLITEKIEEAENRSILDNIVTFEKRSFTLSKLRSFLEATETPLDGLMVTVELKQKDNCVYIFAQSEDELLKVKRVVSDMPEYIEGMVRFAVDEDCVEEPASCAYPGNRIYRNCGLFGLDMRRGTIGFNACYYGQWGVVTCAHVAPSGETMKCADGTLGTPQFSYIGSKVDVAFIPYPAGWSHTYHFLNSSGSGIYREAYLSEMVEGAAVIKYGDTTGKTTGYITTTSSSVSIDYGGTIGVKTLTDMFGFSNNTLGGDSGGPVGRGTTKQAFRLFGITVSHYVDNTGGHGCKTSNIKLAYPMDICTQTNYY